MDILSTQKPYSWCQRYGAVEWNRNLWSHREQVPQGTHRVNEGQPSVIALNDVLNLLILRD